MRGTDRPTCKHHFYTVFCCLESAPVTVITPPVAQPFAPFSLAHLRVCVQSCWVSWRSGPSTGLPSMLMTTWPSGGPGLSTGWWLQTPGRPGSLLVPRESFEALQQARVRLPTRLRVGLEMLCGSWALTHEHQQGQAYPTPTLFPKCVSITLNF